MKRLSLLFLLYGCPSHSEKVQPQPAAPKSACVHRCVTNMIYAKKDIGGDAIAEITKVCVAKFTDLSCCNIGTDGLTYYDECRK